MAAKPSLKAAHDFLDFVNASPTPFHAVASAKQRLEKAGFKPIKERDSWSSTVQPGGKYYLTRNGTSIVAFAVGKQWKAGNSIAMIGAHTDSPCLRIKPVSKSQSDGFLQVAVETYGGGLWHTWFDRDLSIAGRAMVKVKGNSGKTEIQQRLVRIERPILRVPTLAIHLDRSQNFEFNKETQLFPITGLIAAELNRQGKTDEKPDEQKNNDSFKPLPPLTDRHHAYIVELVAEEAGVKPADIMTFDLLLYDTQKSVLGGLNNELIFSARLDNLMMSFCSIEGIINSLSSPSALDKDSTIRLTALFDNEEIGSLTAQGADSNLLPAIIRRLSVIPGSESNSDKSYDKLDADTATAFEQTLSTSFLISADMAHSVHPNYPAKYESRMRPEMNKGVVIKYNSRSYSTDTPGKAFLELVAERAKKASSSTSSASSGSPLQDFAVRNDSPCGGTIGPMLAAKMGVRTLDLGNPQLSMHSIRETAGAHDVEHAINLFESFFINFEELEPTIVVD